MKHTFKYFILLIMSMAILTACTKKEQDDRDLVEEEPKEIEEEEEKIEEEFQFVTPFTGLPTKEENDMRPVLATISNDPKARPQSGLSDADFIYELLTEGNTTRYLALFQSHLPDEIGPIRSSRDMFIHLAQGLDAFYVAHGYSPDALKLLQSGTVDHVNGMQHDGTLFKRSSERYAPHNSYISGDNVLLAAEQMNAPLTIDQLPALSFYESIEDVELVAKAPSITVQNGSHPQFTSDYTYDEQTGVYTQFVNDVETIDYANEKPIELANILVIETDHRTIDAEGRQAIDLEMGGNAILFQAGKVEEVEWKNSGGTIVPVKNGVTMKLVSGKTWVHVLPTNLGIEERVFFTP